MKNIVFENTLKLLNSLIGELQKISKKISQNKTSLITTKQTQSVVQILDELIKIFASDEINQETFFQNDLNTLFIRIPEFMVDLYSVNLNALNTNSPENIFILLHKLDEYMIICYNFLHRQPIIKDSIPFIEHIAFRIKDLIANQKNINVIITELWNKFQTVNNIHTKTEQDMNELKIKLEKLLAKNDELEQQYAEIQDDETIEHKEFHKKDLKLSMSLLTRMLEKHTTQYQNLSTKYSFLWIISYFVIDEIRFVNSYFHMN